jgi:6,7-dimethyl-8-ribityllumazine synthase
VPVINAVVCAGSLEQAIERAGTKAGNKGWDGALAAIEMADVFRKLGKKK